MRNKYEQMNFVSAARFPPRNPSTFLGTEKRSRRAKRYTPVVLFHFVSMSLYCSVQKKKTEDRNKERNAKQVNTDRRSLTGLTECTPRMSGYISRTMRFRIHFSKRISSLLDVHQRHPTRIKLPMKKSETKLP